MVIRIEQANQRQNAKQKNLKREAKHEIRTEGNANEIKINDVGVLCDISYSNGGLC